MAAWLLIKSQHLIKLDQGLPARRPFFFVGREKDERDDLHLARLFNTIARVVVSIRCGGA
ncbi:MAG: hypothetical protein EBT35_07920 [Alphaproteobacteria bacterium]|nr:hypothetical protein [Alphaproteobacteria bacterium]